MEIAGRGIRPTPATATVYYEGQAVAARPGSSVAAALTAGGVLAYRHSAAGDRGLFCGMGVCGECSIVIDGRAGRLACMTPVQDGMRVERQPVAPVVDVAARPPRPAGDEVLTPELLVVGGGPAGLAAAAAAADAGVGVLLVDERGGLGGQYYKQPAGSFALDPARLDHQYRAGRALIERTRQAGVQVLSGARIWGAAGPEEFYAARGEQRWTIRPQRAVLATGAYERAVPFPGWTLPGVLTTGAGQSLLRAYQVAPGARVLIAGNGPLNVQLAAELVRAGAHVVGLVELADLTRPRHAGDLARMAVASPGLVRDGAGYLATLRRARVPMLTGRAVIRVEGTDRAQRAIVARIDASGRPVGGTERSFDVDAVCVGLGFMPGNELARLLGAAHRIDPHTGGYVIERSGNGRTSLDAVWVIGDSGEVRGAKVAEAVGLLAGADVARSLGRAPRDPRAVRRAGRRHARQLRFQRALWRLYAAPALFAQLAEPDTVVCRCESVPLAAIDTAVAGTRTAGAVKRMTRAGMGRCQGRFCGFVVADRVASATGVAVTAFAGFAPQPPIRPTPIAVLAGPDEAG
jgi:thioredoxin reductase